MNLYKGLSYIAFGFLFLFVNVSLKVNGAAINIFPECIGWFLLFLACKDLGSYAQNRKHLKSISLSMCFLTGALWVLSFMQIEILNGKAILITNLISAVFTYLLFSILERVSEDHKLSNVASLRKLKYLTLVCWVVEFIVSLFGSSLNTKVLYPLTIAVLILQFYVCVSVLVTLFLMRNDLKETAK